jgi:hypothetical protein
LPESEAQSKGERYAIAVLGPISISLPYVSVIKRSEFATDRTLTIVGGIDCRKVDAVNDTLLAALRPERRLKFRSAL